MNPQLKRVTAQQGTADPHRACDLSHSYGLQTPGRGGEIEHKYKLEESSPRETVREPENQRLIARTASVPPASPTVARPTPHNCE
jgi:hypothetical protein